MGFAGVVVTDALEMAAINRTYGIAEGAVMALNAGADLLCLGGEDAGERMLDEVRDAIVNAVREGRLSLERLRVAVSRVRRLAVGPTATGTRTIDPNAASTVADAALRIAGPLPKLGGSVLVLRCDDATNLAVGDIPWGLAAATRAGRWRSPGTVGEVGIRPGQALPQEAIRAADSVLVLTRDIHRHDWMSVVLQHVRGFAPSAVLVEMGNAGLAWITAPAIASYGASIANANAVLTTLGWAIDPSQP
jgi:beta-N-acetylhexosaminidase